MSEVHARPWGNFEVLAEGEGYKVKRLTIFPMGKLSLQRHRKRDEFWTIARGDIQMQQGYDREDLTAGRRGPRQTVSIPMGTLHRAFNEELVSAVVIEVQIGECREDDIERLEDSYGRS